MTSFTLNLISVKVSFHDIFKKTLNITPVNITSFTVLCICFLVSIYIYIAIYISIAMCNLCIELSIFFY